MKKQLILSCMLLCSACGDSSLGTTNVSNSNSNEQSQGDGECQRECVVSPGEEGTYFFVESCKGVETASGEAENIGQLPVSCLKSDFVEPLEEEVEVVE